MNPTLCEPDVLEIRPYRDRPIREGDVILFDAPGRAWPIVHRVVNITPDGIRTRGDNSRRPDDWLFKPDRIIGQVITAFRGERRRSVLNGRAGLAWSWLLYLSTPIAAAVNRNLHAPYHAISRLGVFRRWLPPGWRPRPVMFQAGGRQIRRMMWGRLEIGRFDEARGEWRIRRPFRLWIDPRELIDSP
jgi:hypothetical protein